ADKGFLHQMWLSGSSHIFTGTAAAVIAAFLFYLQRSHLAWHYGQIALAQSRGAKSPRSVEELLGDADGWDTWVRYQVGFIALIVSFVAYSYAIVATVHESFVRVPIW